VQAGLPEAFQAGLPEDVQAGISDQHHGFEKHPIADEDRVSAE